MFEEFEKNKKRGIKDVKKALSALKKRKPVFAAFVFLDKAKVTPAQTGPEIVDIETVFGYTVRGYLPGNFLPLIPQVLERLKQKVDNKVLGNI